MKKLVFLIGSVLLCAALFTEPLLSAFGNWWGIQSVGWLVCQKQEKEYEGDLLVITGRLPSGRHIQIAQRNGHVTVGIPYITEGY